MSVIALLLTRSWIVGGVILIIGIIVVIVALLCPKQRKLISANLNSFITMLLGGLWHGASWNFVMWGGLNGIGMIVNKCWRNLNKHWKIGIITILCLLILLAQYYFKTPILNIASVWVLILFIGNIISYVYSFLHFNNISGNKRISDIWAITQTFVFITFTRLFFRSGSNLDPSTQNEIAWQTATQMIDQIGSKWDVSTILPVLLQYYSVFFLFLIGMIIHMMPDRFKRTYRLVFANMPLWFIGVISVSVVFILYQFITADLQPFIYFQF